MRRSPTSLVTDAQMAELLGLSPRQIAALRDELGHDVITRRVEPQHRAAVFAGQVGVFWPWWYATWAQRDAALLLDALRLTPTGVHCPPPHVLAPAWHRLHQHDALHLYPCRQLLLHKPHPSKRHSPRP